MQLRPVLLCALVCLALVNGCSSESPESSGPDSGTALERALGRVAATDTTRQQITFDDTAALASLGETFGALSLSGVAALTTYADQAKGLRPKSASFTVTAGRAPETVSLLAGGQDADEVEKQLTGAGWKRDGDELVAPALGAGGDGSTLPIILARVRTDGEDVVYGGTDGGLSDVGSPDGGSLADDRRVAALASCLGDVVAASFVISQDPKAPDGPTMTAVGVRRPKSGGDTPQALACTAWSTSAAADTYATEVRDALDRGASARTQRPYAELLKSATVRDVGGDEHVVSWQAGTPDNAYLVFQMLAQSDLPALVV
ncbi:hypothetical protein [Cryptosporangium aurantiacum]|uniref:Lipoprotein n=1 Tax=Cryptosporangium aurantiacum TaxID=134849 RepID=A0A1M7RJZ4_9ACTN|nr:hypothetical protein [Cryptosporangium aurantiacum]SHN46633.1 hypothetical protein SAMN05443668_11716 [Cryptosporangium aurantiacum]